jgi:hypothetical protein
MLSHESQDFLFPVRGASLKAQQLCFSLLRRLSGLWDRRRPPIPVIVASMGQTHLQKIRAGNGKQLFFVMEII